MPITREERQMSHAERIIERDIKVLLHKNPSLQAFLDELDQSSWAQWKKTGKPKGSKSGLDPYSSRWDARSREKL
jgi:hypothetical protein